jgi:hypothetical protein
MKGKHIRKAGIRENIEKAIDKITPLVYDKDDRKCGAAYNYMKIQRYIMIWQR